MALTHGAATAVANASTNPVSFSYDASSAPGIVLMLVAAGGTNRAGGSPTYGGVTMTQVGSTQKGAASPEASAEMWMLAAPSIPSGSNTLSIPNSGTLRIDYIVARTSASLAGMTMGLDVAGGGNATSTNPTASITTKAPNVVLYAVVANGAQTWAPSARTGTQLHDTDMGTYGGGAQYLNKAAAGVQAMAWTFGTSEDWGEVVASFREFPNVSDAVTVAETVSAKLSPLLRAVDEAVTVAESMTAVIPVPPLDSDLIVYWPLNEGTGSTSADATGNGHTVTLVNAVWDTTTQKFGAAALQHSAVGLGNRGASFTAMNVGTTHTIAFWINNWAGANDGVLIGGALGYYGCYLDSSSIYYSAGVGNFASRTHGGLTGSRHIAIVRDGSTSITFYKDGVSLGSNTLANANNTDLTVESLLSYTAASAGDFFVFNGTMDDVRIYDVAATASEIAGLYTMVPVVATGSLIAQYRSRNRGIFSRVFGRVN